MEEGYAILLADAVAKKKTTLFFRLQGKATRTRVEKGELVLCVPDNDYKYALYYLETDQAVMLCTEDGIDVSVLTDSEAMLLKAIASPITRYEVYTSGKCTWGQGLHLDDAVSVFIPLLGVLASAVIRYIGKIEGYPGTMFGVEITDRRYSSCGNITGIWQGKRLFRCKSNTGLFASLDMISKLHEGSDASNIRGEEKTSVLPASQQPSLVCGLGALEPSPTSGSLSARKNVSQSTVQASQASSGHFSSEAFQASSGFEIGSLVQVIDPPLYGVIRVMGIFPKIQGMAAGIELEKYRKGCSDGTWCKKRYFKCPRGRGLFCPLTGLKLDQRFADIEPTLELSIQNPLKDWPLEELEDQHIGDDQLVKYLGDGRGIQGHYNSCYLDATVFGLFALSDVFDPMLQTKARDPAGEEIRGMLWKGIVNPLRKNGVVRHESVMVLRNKLEDLGKIKRINQEEKDPEEFLNLLFKHALNVDTFITIKRPFGIEQEYFVQLFLEPNESLKLPPTVGQLLNKMFKEQNISFLRAPDKLLIQIPRYGKHFKTYEKVIPGLQLDVVDLIDHPHCCFVCKNPARKKCLGCAVDGVRSEMPVYFCNSCCSQVHGSSEMPAPEQVIQRCDKEATDIFPTLNLLSVICIETSHYVCFTRTLAHDQNWIFFDSMADRVYDQYNIPKGVDCTEVLNDWIYSGVQRLQSTPYKELPELVRRFTHDIYLCVYTS